MGLGVVGKVVGFVHLVTSEFAAMSARKVPEGQKSVLDVFHQPPAVVF